MAGTDRRAAVWLVRWAAALWAEGDDDVAEMYAEEWVAVLGDAPRWRRLLVVAEFSLGAIWDVQSRKSRLWTGRLLRVTERAHSQPALEPKTSVLQPFHVDVALHWRINNKEPSNLLLMSSEEHAQLTVEG